MFLKIYTVWTAYLLVGLRTATVVIAFMSAFDLPFFGSQGVKIISLVIGGLLQGYCTNALMDIGHSKVNNNERALAAKTMVFSLLLGIVIGSLIAAFGISKINF